MLDDNNVLTKRDSEATLDSTATQPQQTAIQIEIKSPEHDEREITSIVLAGMGGSALVGLPAKTWLDPALSVPFEIVRSYRLPHYVDEHTLVIASSCSGNTEETLAALAEAQARGSQVAVVSGGGKLSEIAKTEDIVHVDLPTDLKIQPRMLTFVQLRALCALLHHFGIIEAKYLDEIAATEGWLTEAVQGWKKEVPTDKNYAKQLALHAVGKTPVFYGGELSRSVAYKWKISWNENAKNVAFWNEYPEFNHNEFMGWTSHPVEKPFAVFDLVSDLESDRIHKRFEISDRLLSGKRPKALTVNLEGKTLLEQLLWGNILADFVSIYVGIMNNVDPGPVPLITKLKEELSS